MHWFRRPGMFLQRINERSIPKGLKFVIFLLNIPVFKASHFFFKLLVTLVHFGLEILGRQCALIDGEDLSVHFRGLLAGCLFKAGALSILSKDQQLP